MAATGVPADACTSLTYKDAQGNVYFDRTLELQMELPYQVVYVPAGQAFRSEVEGHPALEYTSRYGMLAVTMPDRRPAEGERLGPEDLKALEGLNDQGLTFSVLAYPSVAAAQH